MSKEKTKQEQSETGVKGFLTKLKNPKVLVPILGVLLAIIIAIVVIVVNLPGNEETGGEDASKTSYKTSYTINFDSNGGSTVATQFIEAGITVRRPHNPTKEGYYFAGWYEDEALTKAFDFDTIVKGNTTLYAKWKVADGTEENEEQKDNERNPEDNSRSEEISKNDSSSNPEPSPSSDTSDQEHSAPAPAPTPKTYYTVSFNSNGGSAVGSVSVESGKAISAPAAPTKAHYNFAGWTSNGTDYNFGSAVNSNITLTASWSQKNFRLIATSVDSYSPDMILSVTEDGAPVSYSAVYSGGAVIASASNNHVSRSELVSGTYTVVLSDGTTVSAGY